MQKIKVTRLPYDSQQRYIAFSDLVSPTLVLNDKINGGFNGTISSLRFDF